MSAAWKTIRVFISSTFRDMHAERDHLVRVVFPELREQCAKRHLHLVDVDLRWGVTEEDAQRGKALEICLREIEDCRPFFVGLLGERYGWIPPTYDIPDEERFDSLRNVEPGHSITAMEIYQGVLNNPQMRTHAYFYFRNPAFIASLSPERQPDFRAEDDEHAGKLRRLKDRIRASGLPVREGYRHDDLDAFGRMVLEDLWSAIQAEHPEEAPEPDPLDAELGYHDFFVETRTELFVGQRHLLARLHEHAAGNKPGPMVVTGTPGCGKSTLLAKFVKEYQWLNPQMFCFYHFIGVSPTSTDSRQLLLRICKELYCGVLRRQKQAKIREEEVRLDREVPDRVERQRELQMAVARIEAEYDVPEDLLRLQHRVKEFLDKASIEGRCLLVIDALNQLEEPSGLEPFGWLPTTLSPGVRLVVSSLAGETLQSVQRRYPQRQDMIVSSLRLLDQGFIVARQLRVARKRLSTARDWRRQWRVGHGDPWQIVDPKAREQALADEREHERSQLRFILTGVRTRHREPTPEQTIQRETANPLYLKLVAEELRLFNDFDRLGDFIDGLPTDVPGMFDAVLGRLEGDHGRELVEHALSLIATGRHGLLEGEVLELLARQCEERFPMALWSRLYRGLSFYFKPRASFGGGDEGLIDFFHRQLAEVVRERYLADNNRRQAGHRVLMRYFREKADPRQDSTWAGDSRGLSELPYHQGGAGCWEDYEISLTDLAFLDAKCQKGMAAGLLRDYDLVATATTQHSASARFAAFAEFVRDEFENLLRYPLITYQQAANQPADSAVAEAAHRDLSLRRESRPWWRWLNKPKSAGPCQMRLVASTDNVTACDFMSDDQRVVAGMSTGILLMWDLRSGQRRLLNAGKRGCPSACACSPDRHQLISGDDRGNLCFWEVEAGRLLDVVSAHRGVISTCTCSPDGQLVATGSHDGTLKIWEAKTRRLRVAMEVGPVRLCRFSPDGRWIVVGTEGKDEDVFDRLFGRFSRSDEEQRTPTLRGTLQLWRLDSGVCVSRQFVPRLSACGFSRDGTRILTVGSGGLSVWETKTGALLEDHPEHGSRCASLSGDVSRLALIRERHELLWTRFLYLEVLDTAAQAPVTTIDDLTSPPTICALSPSGERLLTVNGNMIRIWDTTWRERDPARRHRDRVTCCARSPDGSTVVSASESGDLRSWSVFDASQSAALVEESKSAIKRCAFSADGSRILAAGEGVITMWNARTRQAVAQVALNSVDISLSPDSRTVASAVATSDIVFPTTSRTQVWDAKTIEAIVSGAEEKGRSVACCFSPDGRWFASAYNDHAPGHARRSWVSVYNAPSGERSATLDLPEPDVSDCDWSPCGRRLAAASAGKLWVWNTRTWEIVKSSADCSCRPKTCDFAPDGRHVFFLSEDSALGVWDSQTGEVVSVFPGRAPISCYGLGSRRGDVVTGDARGAIYFLEPVGLPSCLPHVTVGHVYGFSEGRWEPEPAFSCPGCGRRIPVSASIR
ncbi:MAG: DUF4062 domain-containing protein [Rhodopirellula sp.]|nr:DUF4062 domain-containing protein [Rhodopirellula sp.]